MDERIKINTHLLKLHTGNQFPVTHINHLKKLKNNGFEPKVIYDIGSCVLHWTNEVEKIWPDAKIVLFDAYDKVEFLYKDYDYYIGVLTDTDGKEIDFYQNDLMPGGNSYYREIGSPNADKIFNSTHLHKKIGYTLDTIVKGKGFPLPDLIKIDVQGAESDVITGAIETIRNCQYMIVELQSEHYNLNAPLANESIKLIDDYGFKCVDPLFCNNGPDGDYGFINKLYID